MFKIDNEKEFISFLKILAEESVAKTKSQINENSDNRAEDFKSRLKKEKELYEEEELPGEEAEEEKTTDPELDAGGKEDDEDKKVDSQPEDDEASPKDDQNSAELRASLDSLERNINALRAGRSLKDSTVESQLEIYFDRLGDDEKALMVLFIRELSKILSGEISGSAAADPNDDPYNLDVVTASEEEQAPPESAPTTEPQNTSPSADLPPEEEEEEEEEEDTSPPIRVGEPQNLSEIRKRIRKLMSL